MASASVCIVCTCSILLPSTSRSLSSVGLSSTPSRQMIAGLVVTPSAG